MGCAASSTVDSQQFDSNGNVQNGKGHPVSRISHEVAEQNQPINEPPKRIEAGLVEEQDKPAEEPRQATREPVKPAQEPDKLTQESVRDPVDLASKPAEPVQKSAEPVDEPAAEKQAPVYTEESLKEFLALQQTLISLERRNIAAEYQTQHAWLVSHYEKLQAAQKKVEQLKQQTTKEYQDVAYMQHPNVRAMFSNVHHLQSRLANEQQEYMDALNRQEVAEKELKCIQQEYNALYTEVDTLRKDYEDLGKLRERQEKTLDEIFGGKYGSELEEQLEKETDLLNERKEMVTAARNKWYNAQVLMKHAYDQLGYSTRRWAQIKSVQPEMVQARYSMVAETRNFLIAASQNINNSHRNLSNVDIPYCNSDDLKILNNAITSTFNDIMTQDSYYKALQTYSTLHGKAGTLLRWINMVLEKTINKDLEEIVPQCHTKVLELRRERLRLIHVKTRELQGKDEVEDVPVIEDEPEPEPEPVPEPKSDTRIAEPDTVSLKEDEEKKDDDVAPPPNMESIENPGENETAVAPADGQAPPKPKPLTELAPVPTQDALFGNIEELKTKYEEQVAEFSKAQDVNKARVDQALEDKLRERRNRRKRVELQQLETSELAKGVTRAEDTK